MKNKYHTVGTVPKYNKQNRSSTGKCNLKMNLYAHGIYIMHKVISEWMQR